LTDLSIASRTSANGLVRFKADLDIASRTSKDGARLAADATKKAAQKLYEASNKLFGHKGLGTPETDKSIARRLRFLQTPQTRKGSDLAIVAAALTTHFERRGAKDSPYRSDANLKATLKALQKDQASLIRRGDVKTARSIGSDIKRLKAELGKRMAEVAAKTAGVKAATEVVSAEQREGNRLARTAADGPGRIIGAIQANRPIVNVDVNVNATTVIKKATVTLRYGPKGGSRDYNGKGTERIAV
jgi:hypothetical protein